MKTLRPAAAFGMAMMLLSGCAQKAVTPVRPAATVEVVEGPEWHRKIRTEDEDRIRRVAEAWQNGLAEARARGFAKAVAGEGELLDPAAALERPEPPPGPYRCRLVKLGTQGANRRAFNGYKPFFCYVEVFGQQLAITKQTGSERPAGYLYPDESRRRLIFLGTLSLADEKKPYAYGDRAERDMVGVVERIGPFRYRLAVPWPRADSKIDVMELVPVVQ